MYHEIQRIDGILLRLKVSKNSLTLNVSPSVLKDNVKDSFGLLNPGYSVTEVKIILLINRI